MIQQRPRRIGRNGPYDIMRSIIHLLRQQKASNGRLLCDIFEELPNRQEYPDYYEMIKKPIALSIIDSNIENRQYNTVDQMICDLAQMFYNAKFYNVRTSVVYEDAVVLERILADQVSGLYQEGLVEIDQLPNLGPLPPAYIPSPAINVFKKRSADDLGHLRPTDTDADEEEDSHRVDMMRNQMKSLNQPDGGVRRKRGRPPKVETPTELRIKIIIRELRRYRDQRGRLLFGPFEKIPDPSTHPDYYQVLRNPLSMEAIRQRLKYRRYIKLSQFTDDMLAMFSTARTYYGPKSQMMNDADYLEKIMQETVNVVLAKSDEEILANDNPMNSPATRIVKNGKAYVNQAEHNSVIYEPGDFVHIASCNEGQKPIPAQIIKIWQNNYGEYLMNVCWYYRPEQTVHRADRTFYENEVFKTGVYREHPLKDVIDKCFIMFITRYIRGRPKGMENRQIYVCESRYNEDHHIFNRIKSWKSCLADEVRNKDYEMLYFNRPQVLKRTLSPLLHLLPANAVENPNAPMPYPKMGKEGGPPLIGAIIPAPVPNIDRINLQSDTIPPPLAPNIKQTIAPQQYFAPGMPPTSGANLQYALQNTPPSYLSYLSSPSNPAYNPYSINSTSMASITPAVVGGGIRKSNYISNESVYMNHTAPYFLQPPSATAYTLAIPQTDTNASTFIPEETSQHYKKDVFGRMLWFPVPPLAYTHTTDVDQPQDLSLEFQLRKDEILERKKKQYEDAKKNTGTTNFNYVTNKLGQELNDKVIEAFVKPSVNNSYVTS